MCIAVNGLIAEEVIQCADHISTRRSATRAKVKVHLPVSLGIDSHRVGIRGRKRVRLGVGDGLFKGR